jgi:alanyl-tRNA synthetase
MANIALNIEHSNLNEATKKGVTAFFGEKYNPENVRIVSIPEVSAELCGGTHVASTGEIGIFKITEFTSISAGNKRIFGVTGLAGLELFQYNFDTVKKLGQEFKVQRDQVLDSVEKQKTQLKTLQTQIKNLKQKLLATNLLEWQKEITEIDSIPTLILSLQDGYTGTEIKDIGNALASKKSGLYFILSQLDGQSFFFATISKNLAQNLNLKDLAKHIACEYELKGGGSETMIQGSGPKVSENISSNILNWIKNNKK